MTGRSDRVVGRVLQLFAILTALMLVLLLSVFIIQSVRPFVGGSRTQLLGFLTGARWRPEHQQLFGILPLLIATLVSSIAAVALAAVLAVPAALLVSEWFPAWWRKVVRSFAEIAAHVPPVVYGLFALMVFVPLLESLGAAEGRSLGAVILVLLFMSTPSLFARSIDVFQSVPERWRTAAVSLGASPVQTAWQIVYPAARSRILAAALQTGVRAIGETAAVVMVAGNSPQLPGRLSDSVRTLTGTVLLEMGYAQGVHYQVLFSIAVVLLVLVFAVQAAARRLQRGESGESQ